MLGSFLAPLRRERQFLSSLTLQRKESWSSLPTLPPPSERWRPKPQETLSEISLGDHGVGRRASALSNLLPHLLLLSRNFYISSTWGHLPSENEGGTAGMGCPLALHSFLLPQKHAFVHPTCQMVRKDNLNTERFSIKRFKSLHQFKDNKLRSGTTAQDRANDCNYFPLIEYGRNTTKPTDVYNKQEASLQLRGFCLIRREVTMINHNKINTLKKRANQKIINTKENSFFVISGMQILCLVSL